MGNFIRHERCNECGSSDGKAIYEEDNGQLSHYCWVCKDSSLSDAYRKELRLKDKSTVRTTARKQNERVEILKDKVTQEQTDELKTRTTLKGSSYRGIRDDILKFFQVRTEYDESNEVQAVYYPATENGELVGWKCRTHPKQFGIGNLGRTGNSCEMFGQFFHKSGSQTCLIVGGEHDALAAHQMLKNYYLTKKWDYDPVVVSPLVGETGCAKQIANNYAWFDKFDKIVVGMDNDKAGKEAVDDIVAALPKGKVFVATWSLKDPNEMLLQGKERQFVSNFYEAKQYMPNGILASNALGELMREELTTPKIPLPSFMHKLQDMMAGGIPLGRIVNLGSASGTGKSTIVDELIYFWIFNSPHKIAVVSLESSAGQYAIKLLSRHISRKIELLDNESALSLVNSDEIKQKEKELFEDEEGNPRFLLMDERDGGIEGLKSTIENLVIGCKTKVIVLDPLQDILDGLDDSQQSLFMKWQKGLIKSHHVTFINISHVRKNTSNQKANSTGADLHEEDMHGSSSIFKSGACNLLFSRNKEAEDPIERNTTTMKASKIRWTGKTGVAGKYYYDLETHTLFDLDDWLNNSR